MPLRKGALAEILVFLQKDERESKNNSMSFSLKIDSTTTKTKLKILSKWFPHGSKMVSKASQKRYLLELGTENGKT
jgi:hypothetical protein